jgi:translation elongation factor EF-1beta
MVALQVASRPIKNKADDRSTWETMAVKPAGFGLNKLTKKEGIKEAISALAEALAIYKKLKSIRAVETEKK